MTAPICPTAGEDPDRSPDADIQALAAEAEAGYDVEDLVKRGRPALGSAAASVESVRLDPELRSELLRRAQTEGETPSESACE